MSHFYGELHGATPSEEATQRPTVARRGGTTESGLRAILRSNEGSVMVRVYEGLDESGGLEDRVEIRFERVVAFLPDHKTAPVVGHDFTLYNGPLSECRFESIYMATQESEK